MSKTHIHTLDLTKNRIQGSIVLALAKELQGSPVRKLILDENDINDSGVKALADCLSETDIQVLSLKNCGIGVKGVRDLGKQLQTRNSKIHSLYLGGNPLGVEGSIALIESLQEIEVFLLDLSSCSIQDEEMASLASFLRRSTIDSLNLAFNNIRDQGAKDLAEGIRGSTISTLILGGNRIGAEGAKHLALGLQKTRVRRLYLCNSLTADIEMDELASTLDGFYSCGTTWLGNQFGSEGAGHLIEGLKANRSLHTLGIELCQISSEYEELVKFAERVQQTHLRVIDFRSRLNNSNYVASLERTFSNSRIKIVFQAESPLSFLYYDELLFRTLGECLARFAFKYGMGEEIIKNILQWLPASFFTPLEHRFQTIKPGLGLDSKAAASAIDGYKSKCPQFFTPKLIEEQAKAVCDEDSCSSSFNGF